jgi:hypothetical protein
VAVEGHGWVKGVGVVTVMGRVGEGEAEGEVNRWEV